MNLSKLEYFLSAARKGSFTAAAEEHYVSQTAVSQQIASLERELGVMLFRRKKGRVELTEDKEVIIKFRFAQLDERLESQTPQGIAPPETA